MVYRSTSVEEGVGKSSLAVICPRNYLGRQSLDKSLVWSCKSCLDNDVCLPVVAFAALADTVKAPRLLQERSAFLA